MKNKMQKVLSLVLVLAIMSCTLLLSACRNETLVIMDSDTYIVVKTTEKSMVGATDMTLMDYMSKLKEKGELEYSISDGMITSINGIDNPVDYSKCWMLYTSDADNANAAWGTVEYEGKEYGSAISGAETLKIKPDQLYIWVFKSVS